MYGFLVGVECVDIDLEKVCEKLADSLQWVEGVSKVDVESLGELDVYPEQVTGDEPV